MPKTICSFIVNRPFVQGSTYNVSIDKVEVIIKIEKSNRIDSINTSKVIVEMPFLIEKSKDNFEGDEIKKLCVKYLNRLIDVVRYHTKLYIIERITEDDLFYYEVRKIDEHGKQRIGSGFGFGGPFFPITTISEADVFENISKMLKDEDKVPFYENLLLDSYHYFSRYQFNTAVIICNVALEAIVANHLYTRLIKSGNTHEKAFNTISNIFSLRKSGGEKGGLHKVMGKDFQDIDGRSFKDNHDLWKKFNLIRTVRKNAVHPHITRLNEEKAREAMLNIMDIIKWIQEDNVK